MCNFSVLFEFDGLLLIHWLKSELLYSVLCRVWAARYVWKYCSAPCLFCLFCFSAFVHWFILLQPLPCHAQWGTLSCTLFCTFPRDKCSDMMYVAAIEYFVVLLICMYRKNTSCTYFLILSSFCLYIIIIITLNQFIKLVLVWRKNAYNPLTISHIMHLFILTCYVTVS